MVGMVLKLSSACFCEFATHLVRRVGTHKGCTRRLFVPYHLNNCTLWVPMAITRGSVGSIYARSRAHGRALCSPRQST